MIEVRNLVKRYGEKTAVNNVSFTVEDGTILGFLGPNGAGKSTTMNMLTGYLTATEGDIIINGVDVLDDPIAAKKNIGYLPEIPPLYVDMTVKAYLNFVYDLKKCKLPRKAHLKDVSTLCKINDVQDRIIKHLSKGYRQRVGLAQALIGNPPVLILDEPTVGLDPKQILEIRNLIKKLGRNHTVILSSHILSEIQSVCDQIIIINKGEVAANDTTEGLSKNLSNDHRILVRIDGPKDAVIREMKKIDGVKYCRAEMKREADIYEYEIEAEEGRDIRRDINDVAKANNWYILEMKSMEMSLEDVFLKITLGEGMVIPSKNTKPEETKKEDSKTEESATETPQEEPIKITKLTVDDVLNETEKKEDEE